VSARRWPYLLLMVALAGTYAWRAAEGIRGGWDYDRGRLLRNLGDYPAAAPRLEAAAIGSNTGRAWFMAGEVRLDLWEDQVRSRGVLGADPEQLVKAAEDFLACRCVSPTARRARTGLGEVYDAIEWIGRERRAEVPYVVPEDPWARVGRPGRIAVGMLREAVGASPNWGRVHDRLALTLWNYGLDNLAREAVAESARVLPNFYRHPYHEIPELPDWVAEEFARASSEVLGEVPLFPRGGHLVDLGKLERRNGAHARAIEYLEEALALASEDLRRAEASFHLGLALVAEGRFEEGRARLTYAREHPSFRISALLNLADLAVQLGEPETALGHLRQLRREQPGDLGACLQFARVAQELEDWPAALESLRWAQLKHPDDPRPYVALATVHLSMGDPVAASSVAFELENLIGASAPAVTEIRRRIAGFARPTRRMGS